MTELVLPNNALFGLGIQQGAGATDYAKLIAGYEELVSEANMHYFPLTALGIAPVKTIENLPPEIGGRAFPLGAYVAGAWAEGGASFIARLNNRFGWLLLALHGEVSTVSDNKCEDLAITGGVGAVTAGVNSHVFSLFTANQFFLPWLSLNRLLPHPTAGERVGEKFQDGKIRTATLTAAAGQPVTFDLDLVARLNQSDYVFNIDPETNLSWDPVYDNLEDFGVASCDGHIQINDVAYPAQSIAVTWTNQLLAPAQSLTVGTIHPIDFPTLGRGMQVTVTFLVQNYDLYLSTFTGATVDASASSGENATCTPYEADVDVMVASQTPIGAAGDPDEPFRLRVVSSDTEDNVVWQIRPVNITPGRPVMVQATGTVQGIDTGEPFHTILQNAQTNYELP